MKPIYTEYGNISVEDDTDEETVRILKAAAPVTFTEFVYTGNSLNGENSGNYEDREAFLSNSGLDVRDDDLDILMYNMEHQSGVTRIEHRGKTLTYHVQQRQVSHGSNQFGYTWRAEYRLIKCERSA